MGECTCHKNYTLDTLIPQVGVITDIRQETPDVKTFRVNAPEGGKLFEHMPGQCAMVCAPGISEGMFSITSSPTNKEYQEFSIKQCGILTDYLHSLEVGDEITVRGPYGNSFPVETELKGKNLLFIAGGIGLAPLRSVINYVLDNRENYGTVDIVYGSRSAEDLVQLKEIQEVWMKAEGVNVYLTIDREQDNWDGHVGFVPNYVKELGFDTDRTALVCGPPIMIKFVLAGLKELGFTTEQVYTTLELRMKCGVGKCGRCNIGSKYVCKDRSIAREEPYCLFLDELNACSQEVQKAFYSLILERRIGEYQMPEGSIVVAAGNRAQDSAITRPLSSALLNRMVHVELTADSRVWLEWAAGHGIHPYVYDYICQRPDQLWSQPPKTEEPFSTPRSWHMLSDALNGCGKSLTERELSLLANGCLTAAHASQFTAYVRQVRGEFSLERILAGDQRWPEKPEERDVLYFLIQSFRARLLKELPKNRGKLTGDVRALAQSAVERLVELAGISLELAQLAVAPQDGNALPAWFVVEAAREIPSLARKKLG